MRFVQRSNFETDNRFLFITLHSKEAEEACISLPLFVDNWHGIRVAFLRDLYNNEKDSWLTTNLSVVIDRNFTF